MANIQVSSSSLGLLLIGFQLKNSPPAGLLFLYLLLGEELTMRHIPRIFCLALCLIFLPDGILHASAANPSIAPASPAPYYINGQPAPVDSRESLNDVKQVNPCELTTGYQRFTDHPRGYSICVPGSLQPDFSLSAVRSLFADGPTQIEL